MTAFLINAAVEAGTVLVLLSATCLIAAERGLHRIVDVVWGLGFAVVAVTSWIMSGGHGDVGVRSLALGMTVIWGLRLAVHIGRRGRGHGEDPRYEQLLAKAPGNRTAFAFRRIYLTQAATLWFVSLPVQAAMYGGRIGPFAVIGVVLWAVGLFFETVGDRQLDRFRADPATKGTVLNTGLWRYTRHPNYFGDACAWWGIYAIACLHWPGALTVLSPVLMTFLLARGTGKPLMEKHLGQRAGYAEYVRRTSGFVPLPPKP